MTVRARRRCSISRAAARLAPWRVHQRDVVTMLAGARREPARPFRSTSGLDAAAVLRGARREPARLFRSMKRRS
jgi:hypothetical protein